MAETWYKTSKFDWEIKPIEVAKSTQVSIILKGGRRLAKHTEYGHYFPTLQDAKVHQTERCQNAIKALRKQLEIAESALKADFFIDERE